MKKLMFVLLLVSFCFGRNPMKTTWSTGTEFLDTITGFKADSMKYTEVFNLSGYENLRIDVYVNDTSSAGFSADSTEFIWGIQTGHFTKDSAGSNDTAWNPIKYLCDTLSRLDSSYTKADSNFVEIDGDDSYTNVKKLTDTLNVTGYAYQTCNFAPNYDVLYRGWVKGIANNDKSSFLDIRMLFVQRRRPKR